MPKPKRPFNNRNLFSNHYLENQIMASPEWGRSDHLAAFEEIKKVYDREGAFVGNLSESQLEDRLFRSIFAVSILKKLGQVPRVGGNPQPTGGFGERERTEG